jgi:hypothetical protein
VDFQGLVGSVRIFDLLVDVSFVPVRQLLRISSTSGITGSAAHAERLARSAE